MWKKRPHAVWLSIALVLLLVVTGLALSCMPEETPTPEPTQGVVFELLGYNLPPDSDTSWGVALGDVDNDKDLDIIFANYVQNRLYLNDGGWVFTDATSTNLPADSNNSVAVALGDVDDDGDLDIILANRDEQNRLYLNNGAGAFTDATSTNLPADIDYSRGVALGDVDGDGDLDIIFANSGFPEGQKNRLYLNNGAGVFTDATSTNLPVDSDYSCAVALGDVDGDGDLDIIFANWSYPAGGGQNTLYLNNSAGVFTDATSTNLPADSGYSIAVALGDVDGDENLDIIFANFDYQNRLYLNSGNGTFTNDTSNLPADSDGSEDVALGDVDGDDDLDIIIANTDQNRLYLNNGSGEFTDATSTKLPLDNDYSQGVALGDMDDDGDLDIIFANRFEQNRLYLNNGGGVFTDATSSFPAYSDSSSGVALGDVDGDEDLDIIFANGYPWDEQNRLYLNNGGGAFIDATATNLPAHGDQSTSVALGDVDGDGDLDIIFANADQQNRLYLNNGGGAFTDATSINLPVDSDDSRDVALGDVDGDEDLDIIFANYDQNKLYLNNGEGEFTDATSTNLPAGDDLSLAVALGDVDGDYNLDIIFGNVYQDRLYLNNGSGTFTDATSNLPRDSDNSWGIALGDVDGDGDLDIILAKYWSEQNRLHLNNGEGEFKDATTTSLPADDADSEGVALGDVDDDGDLDIIFANFGQNRLYLNNGEGEFTDATATSLPPDSNESEGVALGDMDDDGDLDIIFANFDGLNRLYTNMGIPETTPPMAMAFAQSTW